jgi:IrrE N-terminal-like domain
VWRLQLLLQRGTLNPKDGVVMKPAAQRADWKELRARVAKKSPEAAASIVRALLRVQHFPVPIGEILSSISVEVYETKTAPWSGAVDARGDGPPNIFLRQQETKERKRFTAAHELGHLLMHPLGVQYRDVPGAKKTPQEHDADRFAAALLMPAHLVLPLVDARFSIDDIAKAFCVSTQVATYRLERLRKLET